MTIEFNTIEIKIVKNSYPIVEFYKGRVLVHTQQIDLFVSEFLDGIYIGLTGIEGNFTSSD